MKKEEEPPKTSPPAQEKLPIYVACQMYNAEAKAKPPKGTDIKSWYQRLTVNNVRFVASGQTIYLTVIGDALEAYSPELLKRGNKISVPLTILVPGAAVNGALLLEVQSVYNDSLSFQNAYPDAKDANSLLVFQSSDGKFSKLVNTEGGSFQISGGPIVSGWPHSMKKKNLDLYKWLVNMFDCFIATSIYESADNNYLSILRTFRDEVMLETEPGRELVAKYYRYGPEWAIRMYRHRLIETYLLRPLISTSAVIISWIDWKQPILHSAAHWGISTVDAFWSWCLDKEKSNIYFNEVYDEEEIFRSRSDNPINANGI